MIQKLPPEREKFGADEYNCQLKSDDGNMLMLGIRFSIGQDFSSVAGNNWTGRSASTALREKNSGSSGECFWACSAMSGMFSSRKWW